MMRYLEVGFTDGLALAGFEKPARRVTRKKSPPTPAPLPARVGESPGQVTVSFCDLTADELEEIARGLEALAAAKRQVDRVLKALAV